MRAESDPDLVTADVAVAGAGYAGLAAALRLHDAGVDVVVVEAAERVGGRVWTQVRGGLPIDHGGQWVGPTQKHLHRLADRFGCPTFPTWETGRHVEVWRDGTAVGYRGAAPDIGPGIEEYVRISELIDELALTVDLDNPWLTPRFAHWDAQTADSFIRAETSDDAAVSRLALAIQGLWCAEPREISMFHVLFYVRSAGGWEQLMDTRGCAQDRRFRDGAAAPAQAVAALLGDRLRLGERVWRIAQTAEGVRLHAAGTVVEARRAVVAVAPGAVPGIEFEPPLPVDRWGWLAHAPMGRVAKVHAIYPEPFWRPAGLSGIATLYDAGPVGVVFDNSPEDARQGALVGFIYGDRVSVWSTLDPARRRAQVLASLAAVVGPLACDPVDYTEQVWSLDRFAHGGYEAYLTPGGWSGYAERGWRTPTGAVHWAGTETASRWNGYIDGAVESGYRAADEVLAALAARHPAR